MKTYQQLLHDREQRAGHDAQVGHDDGPLPEEAWKVILPQLERSFNTIRTARAAFQPIISTEMSGLGITEIKEYEMQDQAGAVATFDFEPQVSDAPDLSDGIVRRIGVQKDTKLPFQVNESLDQTDLLGLQDFAMENGEAVAVLEDNIAYTGHSDFDFGGFLSPSSATSSVGTEWSGNPTNVYDDVKAMKHDLRDQEIPPDNVQKVLFVHSTEAEEGLEQRWSSDNGETPAESLIDAGHIDGYVTTDRQTTGEATLIPMTPRVLRWHLLVDQDSESYAMGQSQRSPMALGTWSASIYDVKKPAAIIKKTGL
jgi:hypothetical protein